MNKYKKMFTEDATKKDLVLEIVKLLNGESAEDCKAVLDAVNYFVHKNAFFDADMARDIINFEGD